MTFYGFLYKMLLNEGEEIRMSVFPAKRRPARTLSGHRAGYQEEGSDYWR